MEKIRRVLRTTDGKYIGTTFDLSRAESEGRIEIGGCIFNVSQILENKIVSANYIVEFTKIKGIDDE